MPGPAYSLAARPVRVKMPAPMMTPMPKTVRSTAVRRFLSWYSGSSVSAIDCSTVFFRTRLICASSTASSQRQDGTLRGCPSDSARSNRHSALWLVCCQRRPQGGFGQTAAFHQDPVPGGLVGAVPGHVLVQVLDVGESDPLDEEPDREPAHGVVVGGVLVETGVARYRGQFQQGCGEVCLSHCYS